jgi:ABC-type uncharacterized transport system substrate-binding protein
MALAPVARALGLTMIVASATNPGDFDAAIETLIGKSRAIIAASSLAVTRRERLLELTNQARIPSWAKPAYDARRRTVLIRPLAGWSARTLGPLVDRILRGAKPADIPSRRQIFSNWS